MVDPPDTSADSADATGAYQAITQFIRAYAGGPTFYVDSDETVDVQMTDRFGRPWFLFRSREGEKVSPGARFVREEGERERPPRGYRPEDLVYEDPVRHSGVLEPAAFPTGPFKQYMPWHMRVMESDVLIGRRGSAGWDGKSYDAGQWITPYIEPTWLERVWGSVKEWCGNLPGWLRTAIEVVAVVAAVVLIVVASIAFPVLGVIAGVALAAMGVGWAAHEMGLISDWGWGVAKGMATTALMFVAMAGLFVLCPPLGIAVGAAMLGSGAGIGGHHTN